MNLALWLKKNRYRADQVQTFLPSPMATATAMYHTGVNPLRGVRRGGSDKVEAIKGLRQRRLHKAFLRYHDPDNWPLLREALKRDGPRRPDRLAPRPARAGPPAARHRQGRRHAAARAPRRQDAALYDEGSARDEVNRPRGWRAAADEDGHTASLWRYDPAAGHVLQSVSLDEPRSCTPQRELPGLRPFWAHGKLRHADHCSAHVA